MWAALGQAVFSHGTSAGTSFSTWQQDNDKAT